MALLKYWDGTKFAEFGAKAAEEVAVQGGQPAPATDLWVDTDEASFEVSVADTMYLRAAGGAMRGPLSLAADPALPEEAATRRYTDGLVTVSEDPAPASSPRDGVLWVQVPVGTTTTLAASSTSPAPYDTVTLTATVTADAGRVEFRSDGIAHGPPVPVDASGVATTTWVADTPRRWEAHYLGTRTWLPSNSASPLLIGIGPPP